MMNEMWYDCWTNTGSSGYPQQQQHQQPTLYDDYNPHHPMIETAHSYHHPYKPKQRFAHFIKSPDIQNVCNDIESACVNTEVDQPTPTAIIHHHHYLSQSNANLIDTAHQLHGKDDFQPLTSSTQNVLQSKSPMTTPINSDTNHEHKQFTENNTVASLIKANSGKIPGSITVNVPCLVCGDEASGFHYGVNSCEGCKGFFRRCITQGMSHRCNNTSNCEITPFSRNSCQYCRLKKCFDVGMSREASRLGRRPKRPRSDTVNPIKNEKEQPTANTLMVPSPTKMSAQVEAFVRLQEFHRQQQNQSINQHEKFFKQQTPPVEREKQSSPTNRIDSVSSTTSNVLPSPYRASSVTVETPNSSTSSSFFPECLFQHRQPLSSILAPEMHREIARKLSSMLLYQEKLLTDIEGKEIDHIAQVIIGAHLQFCVCTFEKIQMKIEENPPIWADSVSDDLNCDPALVWANWQLSFPFESILRTFKYYTFFQQISQDDQICLFRHGAFETILVSWFTLFDGEQKLMLTPDFSAYMDRDFIKTIKTLGVIMLEIFDLGMKASHLRWTDSDIALFNALLLMNPERPDLCDKQTVGQIEAKLMQVLYRHLRRHHPNEPNMFLDVLQLIPSIQEVNQIHLNAVQYIKRHEPQIFSSLPDVHRETYEGLSP